MIGGFTNGQSGRPEQLSTGVGPESPERAPAQLEQRSGGVVTLSIVSNSRLLRDGLPALLSSYFTLEIVENSPAEPISVLNTIPLQHVALLDCRIGPDLVFNWIRCWRAHRPPAYVVMMELADECKPIVEFIAAGASAYVLQGASIAELAETIVQVRQGLTRCSPEVAAHVFARLEAVEQLAAQHVEYDETILTQRELEVLDLVARGYSNKEIASTLVIALHTVKHHVHNILDKLQLSQREQAARLAIRKGWVRAEI